MAIKRDNCNSAFLTHTHTSIRCLSTDKVRLWSVKRRAAHQPRKPIAIPERIKNGWVYLNIYIPLASMARSLSSSQLSRWCRLRTQIAYGCPNVAFPRLLAVAQNSAQTVEYHHPSRMEISAAHGTTTGAAQGTEVFQFILHFKWEGFLKVMFFFCVVSLYLQVPSFFLDLHDYLPSVRW